MSLATGSLPSQVYRSSSFSLGFLHGFSESPSFHGKLRAIRIPLIYSPVILDAYLERYAI